MLGNWAEGRAPSTSARLARCQGRLVPLRAPMARRQFMCAPELVGLYFYQTLLLDIAIISLDSLINLNYLIPLVNIAEFLATATSCDRDFHSLISKSNSIGRSVCFTCELLRIH